MNLQLLQAVAHEMRQWPEARRLALEAMLTIRAAYTGEQIPGIPSMYDQEVAELAVELNEIETARKVLREWQSSMRVQQGINAFNSNYQQQIPVMDLMVRVGMTSEAQAMLKELKSNPMLKNDSYGKQKVEDFENRLALLAGHAGRARLTVWSVPAPVKEAPTVVCWEIGQASKAQRFNGNDPFPVVMGEDLTALDGK